MRSSTPKLLHTLCGRSLVGHVITAAQALKPQRLAVVVGHQKEAVSAHVTDIAPDAVIAEQTEQLGTGNAVRMALESLGDVDGTVVVLCGDAPLLTADTLAKLVEHHADTNAATVLSATVPDPAGLGRIVRDSNGHLAAIVEERDADADQRAIREINSGMFAFDGVRLASALKLLTTDNAQGQEYLTDVVALLRADGHPVDALVADDYRETLGCNNRVELATLRALMRDRLLDGWMRAGVTVIDPATVWVDVDVTIGQDTVIHPNVTLCGSTFIGSDAEIGPDTTLIDTTVDDGARVIRAHADHAHVGPHATVGPYAYLRPGTVLARKSKVGTFVETKNAQIGEGSKVPHLTYAGDVEIGEHSNIGASSVFVNYDGVNKNRSVVGSHVRTGSDNTFVAPVRIGDGAYTGAGAVVREDVPPGALSVSAGRQRNIEGWTERKRPGTPSADAAARAATETSAENVSAGEESTGSRPADDDN